MHLTWLRRSYTYSSILILKINSGPIDISTSVIYVMYVHLIDLMISLIKYNASQIFKEAAISY
jgi:hypothetical protein